MRLVRRHNVTKQQAIDAINDLLPDLMTRFGTTVSDPRYEWHDNTVEFSGRVILFNIGGSLQVTDDELVLDVQGIPFFKQASVKTKIERWLNESWPT